ncbi:MAG: hypothetical protein ACOYT8_01460 [Candidatus Dependentiae bacterium]
MKKILITLLSSCLYFTGFGYTKKMEYFEHPVTHNEVVVFYDFHEDHLFPQEAKQQVKEIVAMAKKMNAHIVIENVWNYQGSNPTIKEDLLKCKYKKPALLLRDVQDLAEKMGVAVTNVEYRQDREYSSRETRKEYCIPAQEALQTVTQIIDAIKSFDGPEALKNYYKEVLKTTAIMHERLVEILDGKKTILEQLAQDEIDKQIIELKAHLPQDCAEIDADEVILFYDSQLLNPLMVNKVYELHKIPNAPCVFVIAGSFHTCEVSQILQDVLGYELVDTQGELEEAFTPAQTALELAQVEKFFNDSILSTVVAQKTVSLPNVPMSLLDFGFTHFVV